MSNDVATNSTTTQAPTGVRPVVKIGGAFPSNEKNPDSPDAPTNAGDWAFQYRSGEKTLEVVVRINAPTFMTLPQPVDLTMDIDAEGIQDLIGWLYGVKTSIASVS